MSLGELVYLTILILGAALLVTDAVNSCTAAVRELLQVMRKEIP